MADSTVKVVFLGDAKDLKKALDDVDGATDKASGRFADFGKKAAIGLGAGGLAAGAAFIKFGQLGLQLESMGKKTQTVFEGATADVKAWADANAKSMGLTDDKLEQLAASFGDLLKPMGFTAQQAASMSKDVVGLSGALSAWSGGQRTAAEVSQILAKAMLGERDGLKELGISITEADVSARLLAKGQQDLTGAALEQAKALATQELIFEKSADAQKAWADGSMSAIQSQNSLRSSMGELQEQLATRLAPAFAGLIEFLTTRVIPAFDSLAAWVRENWPQIRATIEDVMTRIREVIETVLGAIQRFWGTWGDEIMLVVRTVFEFIRTWIESTMKIIQGVINVIMGLIHGDFSQVWEGIKQIFAGALQYIQGLVHAAMGLLQATISAGMTLIAGIFDAAWDAIKNATGAAAGWVRDRLYDLFVQLPGQVGGAALGAGTAIIGALFSGLETLWDKMRQFTAQLIVSLWGMAWEAGKAAADIGLAIVNSIIDAIGDLGGKIWDRISGGLTSLAGKIKDKLTFDIPGIDIPGFATGGYPSGLSMVGEHGPELAYFNPGSKVWNAAETRQLLSGARTGNDSMPTGGGGQVINNYIYIGKVNAESPGAVNNMAATMSRELAVALRGAVA